MQKTLLLLCLAPLVLACGSNADTAREKPDYTLADDQAPPALNTDSAAGNNLSAVARQPQVDTSITNIGTEPTGGAVVVGAKLIEGSDCTTCHRANEAQIGPAYVAIAQKYPATAANVSMLAGKVISGGQGNWGQIPMTPHPNLSKQDAETMVRYILSLK